MTRTCQPWWVGFFMMIGLLALLFLAYRVSNFGYRLSGDTYAVTAKFDHVGDLQLNAPVKLAGVKVGEVSDIVLDKDTYEAVVTMYLGKRYPIPTDSSANILTSGLLGANYIGLTAGFEEGDFLKEGGEIEETYSALILENIIGKLLFSFSGQSSKNDN